MSTTVRNRLFLLIGLEIFTLAVIGLGQGAASF